MAFSNSQYSSYYSSQKLLLIFVICQISPTKSLPLSASSDDLSVLGAPSADLYKKWPNATVYYEISDELSSVKESIEQALRDVENVTCVRYIPRTNQVDYVTFEHNSTRCYEPVGRQGGHQSIYINTVIEDLECGTFGFFVHAAMQLLGFHHEHQRWDRDSHVSIDFDNIKPEWIWAFDKLNSTSHFYNSTYDLDSIMQYGSYQFSKDGKPTMLTRSGGLIKSWSEKAKLSPGDILAINNFYGCNMRNQL